MKILFFIFVLSSFGFSQTKPCSANLKKAQIRGFSLGMSKEQIDTKIKDIKWKKENNGLEVSEEISKFPDQSTFSDIEKIVFKTLNNTLINIDITYNDPRMTNIGVFADSISKSWKISEKFKGEGLVTLIECRERTAILTATLEHKNLSLSDRAAYAKNEKKSVFVP